MQDPWLAVDGITSPRARARQLHRAWERYRAGRPSPDDGPAGVRAPIAESWHRSSAAGFDSSVGCPGVTARFSSSLRTASTG